MKPEELEYDGKFLTPESAIKWMLAGNTCINNFGKKSYFKNVSFVRKHNDGEEYQVTVFAELKPILPDPHADLKAEYEQAISNGKIVKVFYKHKHELANGYTKLRIVDTLANWDTDYEYKLVYYRIDLSKLLSWSYSFGEGKEKLVKIDDGDTRDNIRFMKYVHYDFKPVIANMKLTVYNNETQQEELVDIPDFCLVKIEKDIC